MTTEVRLGKVGQQITNELTETVLARYVQFSVTGRDGMLEVMDFKVLMRSIAWACEGFEEDVDSVLILQETVKNIFDGISKDELADALILGAVSCIERDPSYGYVAGRFLLKRLFREVTQSSATQNRLEDIYS